MAKKPRPEIVSPLCRRTEAIALVQGEGMLRRMEERGWLKAVARRAGYCAFKREDVLAAVARILAGELP